MYQIPPPEVRGISHGRYRVRAGPAKTRVAGCKTAWGIVKLHFNAAPRRQPNSYKRAENCSILLRTTPTKSTSRPTSNGNHQDRAHDVASHPPGRRPSDPRLGSSARQLRELTCCPEPRRRPPLQTRPRDPKLRRHGRTADARRRGANHGPDGGRPAQGGAQDSDQEGQTEGQGQGQAEAQEARAQGVDTRGEEGGRGALLEGDSAAEGAAQAARPHLAGLRRAADQGEQGRRGQPDGQHGGHRPVVQNVGGVGHPGTPPPLPVDVPSPDR